MDSRAKRVIKDINNKNNAHKGYTDEMIQYYIYLEEDRCSSEHFSVAFDIYDNPLKKEIIESLLFGEAEYKDVEDAFGVSVKSLEIYHHLFFNTDKFRNKLDKLAYLDVYPNKVGKELKMRSMNLGPEFIYYTYANIVPKTSKQKALVQRMFMASAYKAMSINYNTIDSKITKNALEHAKLMLKAFEALQRVGEEDLSDETDLIKVLSAKSTKDLNNHPLVKETDII